MPARDEVGETADAPNAPALGGSPEAVTTTSARGYPRGHELTPEGHLGSGGGDGLLVCLFQDCRQHPPRGQIS